MISISAITLFSIYCIVETGINTRRIAYIHKIKERDGYEFDPSDLKYKDIKSVIKVAGLCLFVGALGGIVGITGGILTNTLFLSFGMIPLVVASTN